MREIVDPKARAWGLTESEAAVLASRVAGQAHREYVTERAISPKTYECHVRAILAKARKAGDAAVGGTLDDAVHALLREAAGIRR